MTRRRPRPKPTPPRVIVTEPGFNTEAFRLPANGDVEVKNANREHEKGAHRKDVFRLLSTRKRGLKRDLPPLLSDVHMIAIRRLETDVHIAHGARNTEDGERVSGGGCQERITQRQIDAKGDVKAILKQLPLPYALLADDLLCPVKQGSVITRWRDFVQLRTGKRDEAAQSDVIQWLCASVAAAYQALDYGERRRA